MRRADIGDNLFQKHSTAERTKQCPSIQASAKKREQKPGKSAPLEGSAYEWASDSSASAAKSCKAGSRTTRACGRSAARQVSRETGPSYDLSEVPVRERAKSPSQLD